MIVLDTSVAVALIGGNPTARAHVRNQRLMAPHLIDAEVAHALRGLVLGRKLEAADAQGMLADWAAVAIDRVPMTGLLPRVWELREYLTAYDSVFVAAAEVAEVPLVTADQRLAAAPGIRCVVEVLPR